MQNLSRDAPMYLMSPKLTTKGGEIMVAYFSQPAF